MYPSKENFPHKEKRRVRISDGRKIFHQRKQPANRALSFSLSFFLFLFFSSFSRCHRFLISRFINLGFSNFIHRLIILLLLFFFCAIIFLDIFPSLSLWILYIYIYILIRQPNGAIFESGVSPDPTSGSNIVRMKFSQTLLVYKNPIRTRHKRKRREGI